MANDNDPAKNVDVQRIEIKGKKAKAEDVPVNIIFTKRRQLDAVLDLLDGFTPREVKQIIKVYKRRRKTTKLQQQNKETLTTIIEG